MSYIKKRATAPFNGRVALEQMFKEAAKPSNARYDKEIEYAATGSLYPDENLDERVDAVVNGVVIGESHAFVQQVRENVRPVVEVTSILMGDDDEQLVLLRRVYADREKDGEMMYAWGPDNTPSIIYTSNFSIESDIWVYAGESWLDLTQLSGVHVLELNPSALPDPIAVGVQFSNSDDVEWIIRTCNNDSEHPGHATWVYWGDTYLTDKSYPEIGDAVTPLASTASGGTVAITRPPKSLVRKDNDNNLRFCKYVGKDTTHEPPAGWEAAYKWGDYYTKDENPKYGDAIAEADGESLVLTAYTVYITTSLDEPETPEE